MKIESIDSIHKNGGFLMLQEDQREERILSEARYIVEHNATIRQTAHKFHVSKTCTYVDVAQRLQKLDYQMYLEVRKVLDLNLAERALRGGKALKKKCKK